MTHHKTSNGRMIPIVDMNDWHLHNAIKKLSEKDERHPLDDEGLSHLTALRAEQQKRGGPPKPKDAVG